jgi:hypothetical protein
VAWRGVAWRGVAWRGVAWRGVAWRGVAWRGVLQVVVMPYNMLLHGPTRQSLGLNLHNAVVILDEAHNIVDAVNGMHSAVVTAGQVCAWVRAVAWRAGGQ